MALGRSITGWFVAAGIALLCLCPQSGAFALDMQVGNADLVIPAEPEPLLSSLSALSTGAFSNGVFVAGGAVGYGVSNLSLTGAQPVVMHSLNTSVAASDITDIGGEYATRVLASSDIGVFGHMAERQSPFNFLPATAWDLGGSLGYGGFYVRAGLSATSALGPLQATQGWQAGFGFATGALDLRVTYLTAQTTGTLLSPGELDSQQWTLGGIYALSSSVRLNADAFYGMRDSRSLGFFTPTTSSAQAPQGTGARLGIQLRF